MAATINSNGFVIRINRGGVTGRIVPGISFQTIQRASTTTAGTSSW
jgi:hypothetical protein